MLGKKDRAGVVKSRKGRDTKENDVSLLFLGVRYGCSDSYVPNSIMNSLLVTSCFRHHHRLSASEYENVRFAIIRQNTMGSENSALRRSFNYIPTSLSVNSKEFRSKSGRRGHQKGKQKEEGLHGRCFLWYNGGQSES
jgi:hypothetical protein